MLWPLALFVVFELDCASVKRMIFPLYNNVDPDTTGKGAACASIAHGSSPDGTACAFDAECTGGECQRDNPYSVFMFGPAESTCGTCATRQAAGKTCNFDTDCEHGYSCQGSSSYACTKISDVGEACNPSQGQAECFQDLRCVSGACAAAGVAGASCTPQTTSSAVPDTTCDWTAGLLCDAATSTCKAHAVGAAGDSCLTTGGDSTPNGNPIIFMDMCGPGLRCATGELRATCVPAVPTGGGCLIASGPDGSLCAAGNKCVAGACVADTAQACVGYAAPQPPAGANPGMFTLAQNLGGPILQSVTMQTVTFAGYDNTSHVAALGDWIFQPGGWFSQVGAEYDVGKGSHNTPIELSDMPAATSTIEQVKDFLIAEIKAGKLPTPPAYKPSSSFVYMVYLPSGLSVSGYPFGASCTDWSGMHDFVAYPYSFTFALIAECGGDTLNGITISQAQELDSGATHELFESATDPALNASFAWSFQQAPLAYFGGELADVCEDDAAPAGSMYFSSRVFSNAAAAAGTEVCVPAIPSYPFFSVTGPAVVTGAAGTTVMVPVTGWAQSARANWTITPRIISAPSAFTTANLTTDANAAQMNVGVTSNISVAIPAGLASGTQLYLDVRSLDAAQPADEPLWVYTVQVQ